MKGLEVLNALIQKYEEQLEIAELQIMQNIHNTGSAGSPYKGWPRTKRISEQNLKVLKTIKREFTKELEGAKSVGIKVKDFCTPHRPGFSVPRLCWSNYRCMLLWNRDTLMIDPIFWTPELGIDNSHYALRRYADKFKSIDGYLLYDYDYRWGGFYTYGLGNGNQKQLTLYGESSDYPHDEWSEKVKECFLAGEQFLPEVIESETKEEIPF